MCYACAAGNYIVLLRTEQMFTSSMPRGTANNSIAVSFAPVCNFLVAESSAACVYALLSSNMLQDVMLFGVCPAALSLYLIRRTIPSCSVRCLRMLLCAVSACCVVCC